VTFGFVVATVSVHEPQTVIRIRSGHLSQCELRARGQQGPASTASDSGQAVPTPATETRFPAEELPGETSEAMPSRWVEKELRRLRQSNPQKRWEGNDLNDVTALSIVVPYCDVVITERSWTAMLNSQKISRRFNTQVLHDLRELPDLLQA
jgi:hypothetical protein